MFELTGPLLNRWLAPFYTGVDTAYDDAEVFLICEAMKGFYCEIITRRRGEIQVALRPPIIHEALGRAYSMLLTHQDKILENDRTLQV